MVINMENEITEEGFFGISENMLPEIISGQVREIQSLETSIKNAVSKAEAAKELAKNAKESSAGIFQKKGAIELLQAATLSLAEAESATVEAQEVSFECQKKIGEITKYLFALGCTNMAANRSVVRELKLILEGASGSQLDELAKREVINVIRQLKAQEDIINKQSELSRQVKEQEELLHGQEKELGETRAELTVQAERAEETEKTALLLREENRALTLRLESLETELWRRRNALKLTVASLVTSATAAILAIIGFFI